MAPTLSMANKSNTTKIEATKLPSLFSKLPKELQDLIFDEFTDYNPQEKAFFAGLKVTLPAHGDARYEIRLERLAESPAIRRIPCTTASFNAIVRSASREVPRQKYFEAVTRVLNLQKEYKEYEQRFLSRAFGKLFSQDDEPSLLLQNLVMLALAVKFRIDERHPSGGLLEVRASNIRLHSGRTPGLSSFCKLHATLFDPCVPLKVFGSPKDMASAMRERKEERSLRDDIFDQSDDEWFHDHDVTVSTCGQHFFSLDSRNLQQRATVQLSSWLSQRFRSARIEVSTEQVMARFENATFELVRLEHLDNPCPAMALFVDPSR